MILTEVLRTLDFPTNYHTYNKTMNKQQLIHQATVKYYAQLQREHEYRQRVRAGLIEQCPSSHIHYL
jgi:hypothetical protein